MKSNSASSVTFMIVATTVDLISIKVTATAQDASGAQFTDMVDKKLIVKVFLFDFKSLCVCVCVCVCAVSYTHLTLTTKLIV